MNHLTILLADVSLGTALVITFTPFVLFGLLILYMFTIFPRRKHLQNIVPASGLQGELCLANDAPEYQTLLNQILQPAKHTRIPADGVHGIFRPDHCHGAFLTCSIRTGTASTNGGHGTGFNWKEIYVSDSHFPGAIAIGMWLLLGNNKWASRPGRDSTLILTDDCEAIENTDHLDMPDKLLCFLWSSPDTDADMWQDLLDDLHDWQDRVGDRTVKRLLGTEGSLCYGPVGGYAYLNCRPTGEELAALVDLICIVEQRCGPG